MAENGRTKRHGIPLKSVLSGGHMALSLSLSSAREVEKYNVVYYL